MLNTIRPNPRLSKIRTYFFISTSIKFILFEAGISSFFKSLMLASLIPIRIAVLCIFAASIIRSISDSFFIFPGLSLIFAAPASIASIARSALKWISAIRGTLTCAQSLRKPRCPPASELPPEQANNPPRQAALSVQHTARYQLSPLYVID